MSASRIDLMVALIIGSSMAACRIGGPSTEPSAPSDGISGDANMTSETSSSDVSVLPDVSIETADADRPDTSTATDRDLGEPAEEKAERVNEAGDVVRDTVVRAENDQADAVLDAPPAEDGGCSPPFTSAVCDPVCNTGCPFLSRCDIADGPRTGACIGIWISGEGTGCLKTASTDPCAVQLSCVEGACRRLCYRDSDCTTAGTCCNTSIDTNSVPSGYKACKPCTP